LNCLHIVVTFDSQNMSATSPVQPPKASPTTAKTASPAQAAAPAAAAAAGGAGPVSDAPKNHIRVSPKRSKFLYIDITKYLLNEGESYVEISGLGNAIAQVVDIAEVLKAQGLVKVTKIETSRVKEGARPTDRLVIRVEKSSTFATVFAEQQAMKEQRKAAAAATATATTTEKK